jgi:hypothetical protein
MSRLGDSSNSGPESDERPYRAIELFTTKRRAIAARFDETMTAMRLRGGIMAEAVTGAAMVRVGKEESIARAEGVKRYATATLYAGIAGETLGDPTEGASDAGRETRLAVAQSPREAREHS